MATTFDLDAYFERIHWRGGTWPTLEALDGQVRAHMRHIPFENLDVLLGRPVRLDLHSLEQKLVHGRRGGYCFEHMTLFAAAIESLGFLPARHSARVLLMSAHDESPRTHMFLTVAAAGARYVLDPGFGGPAPTFPVPLMDFGAAGPADASASGIAMSRSARAARAGRSSWPIALRCARCWWSNLASTCPRSSAWRCP